MDVVLEERLVADFPQFFVDHGGDPMVTCMSDGCAVGDGWESIIRGLCEGMVSSNPPPGVKFAQIKEKFGTLRVYMDGATGPIHTLVDEAERRSGSVCEYCGSEVDVTTAGGWLKTLCGDCRIKE